MAGLDFVSTQTLADLFLEGTILAGNNEAAHREDDQAMIHAIYFLQRLMGKLPDGSKGDQGVTFSLSMTQAAARLLEDFFARFNSDPLAVTALLRREPHPTRGDLVTLHATLLPREPVKPAADARPTEELLEQIQAQHDAVVVKTAAEMGNFDEPDEPDDITYQATPVPTFEVAFRPKDDSLSRGYTYTVSCPQPQAVTEAYRRMCEHMPTARPIEAYTARVRVVFPRVFENTRCRKVQMACAATMHRVLTEDERHTIAECAFETVPDRSGVLRCGNCQLCLDVDSHLSQPGDGQWYRILDSFYENVRLTGDGQVVHASAENGESA